MKTDAVTSPRARRYGRQTFILCMCPAGQWMARRVRDVSWSYAAAKFARPKFDADTEMDLKKKRGEAAVG